MDTNVGGLLHRIQTQLGSMLRDSGSELPHTGGWVQNSRSPDQFKPDESGISSEEGCLPQPVHAQLTGVATLFNKLKAKLEMDTSTKEAPDDGTKEEEGSKESRVPFLRTLSPELVVLGPAGTQPQAGKTLARYNAGMSVVYSRSSSQLVTCGQVPNSSQVTLKDSPCSLRRAEVTVVLPTESRWRWTRAGARAVTSTHPLGMNYFEKDTSSSEYSSSEEENSVFQPEVERKKRVRRKQRVSRGSRGLKNNASSLGRGIAGLMSSGEEGEREPESEEEGGNMEDVGCLESGVQMECEVGDEDSESPIQTFLFPSPQAALCSPQLSVGPVSTTPITSAPMHVFTVYEDLNKLDSSMLSMSTEKAKSYQRMNVSGAVVGGGWEKRVKPCSVTLTRLPQYHHTRVNKTTPGVLGVTHRTRRDSKDSSSDTSSSSESVSMLTGPRSTGSRDFSTGSKLSGPASSPSLGLTPRRLKSVGRKSPVAKRSLPFSKPPHTTPTNVSSGRPTSPTANAFPTTPSRDTSLAKSPASSPNPLGHTAKSPVTSANTSTPPPLSLTALPSAEKSKSGATGVGAVPVDWSSDDDFEVEPSPSLIVSPAVPHPSTTSSTPVTKKRLHTASSSSSLPSSPVVVSLNISPHSSKSDTATSAGGGGRGSEKPSGHCDVERSPVKAAAHSMTEDTVDAGEGLPSVISCAGCGKMIRWRMEQIHKHKKLDVLICQRCWMVYHTGSFEVVDGSEIYCTLCGDGGNIICCDNTHTKCSSSFCQSCIRRIAGEGYLARLVEDETLPWQCFCCNKAPLVMYHRLCTRLCEYYAKDKLRQKELGRIQGKAHCNSDTDSDSFLRGARGSEQPGDNVGGEKRGKEAGHSEGGGGGRCDEGERSRSGECDGDGKEVGDGTDRCGGNNGGERNSGRSSGAGGGDKKKSNRKHPHASMDLSDSEVESSSCDGDESPRVDTDDVSMSDTSLFDENCSIKPKETSSGDKPGNDKHSTVSGEPDRQPKKKMLPGLSARRAMMSSDSDSDFESVSKTVTPRRRAISSVSSSSSSISALKNREEKKKTGLLNILSSGSENEGSPQKTRVRAVHNSDDSESDGGPAFESPGSSQDHSIVYATPRKLDGSSDSEQEITVLERKQKSSGRFLGSDSDSGGPAAVEKETTTTKGRDDRPKKKRKRRRMNSSSDDFEGTLEVRGVQLKRRRVARALLSDSDSDDDSVEEAEKNEDGEEEDGEEEKSTPGRKRKKIRRLLTDAKLQATTKEAQRAERQRIERLKKRKVSTDAKQDELILEEGPATERPLVKVRQSLIEAIKPHQREGIKFLYESCVEKMEMFKQGKSQSGAILAHCMGLGKTLQVIAFMDALLMHEDSGVERVLVLSPVNTIYNWRDEFERWIPCYDCDYNIYLLVDTGVEARSRKLQRWFEGGGVLFVGYEMFRNLVLGKRLRTKKREAFEKYLLDPGPDIIVCDEGHVMRNASSHLSMVLQRVRTLTRIVLTGTPLQNNLVEYHTMVSFVKPNLLGTLKEFKNRFINPITNGQCQDSGPADVRLMKNRAHVLHEMLSGTVQRRDYRVLARFLPPKQEFVLFIRLSPVQEQLYTRYLDKSSGQHTASDLFSTFSNLQKVWNHPWVLKLDEERRYEREERRLLHEDSDGGSLDGFIVSGSDLDMEEEEEEEELRKKKKRKRKKPCTSDPSSSAGPSRSLTPAPSCATGCPQSNPNLPTSTTMLGSSDEDDMFPDISIKPDPDAPQPFTQTTPTDKPAARKSPLSELLAPVGARGGKNSRSSSPQEWYGDILTPECEGSAGVSGKLLFLLELLQEAGKLKEKVLVFTQSILTLNLIEEVLSRPENGDWTPGLDYYRLDGSTRSEMRAHQMSDFNEVANEQLRLYLISTRAGSLGVNLVAANRVIIFDACWNPSHDLQAVFRTYRFGQIKPIFVYRLLAKGTMEEKIYDRQVTKESLAMRVVDEKQIGRHYNAADLAELFTYSPAPPPPPNEERQEYERPENDMVLQSILSRLQPEWVINHHEHDSLFKHVFSEELSEEERKAAWDEYKAHITKYDNATYYNALQDQLDSAGASVQSSTLTTQLSGDLSGGFGGVTGSGEQQSILENYGALKVPPSLQASELLTVLSNTNRNVKRLIEQLRGKESLGATLAECQRRHIPTPPNLTAMMMENGKNITAHYALVEEGVRRVNTALQRCHVSEVHLEPGTNQLINEMRLQLIKSLDILRSGSKKPVVPSGSVRAGVSSGMTPQHQATLFQTAHQLAQAQVQAQAQQRAALVNNGLLEFGNTKHEAGQK